MRKTTALFICCLTTAALAKSSSSFTPKFEGVPAPERALLQQAKFADALQQWPLQNGTFATTPTGQALYAYLLWQNKMPMAALEVLFSIKNPKSIDAETKELWSSTAIPDNAWRLVSIRYTSDWNSVFGSQIAATVKAWQTTNVTSNKEIKQALAISRLLSPKSPQKAWIDWQVADAYGVKNNIKAASSILQQLLVSNQNFISHDEIYLTMARIFYQNKKLTDAIRYYDKVSKGSDFWIDALEEKAWAYLWANQPEKTLAQLQTVMAPLFESQVGPEPYFLQGLTDLKTCNYYGVFHDLKFFKDRYEARLAALQSLTDKGSQPDPTQLPRQLKDDELYARASAKVKQAQRELATAPFDIKDRLQSDLQSAQMQMKERLQVLAQRDVHEIAKILPKMNLLEVEAIQRTHTGHILTGGSAIQKQNSHSLEFPYDGEVWLDELDHYQVSAKTCTPIKRKKL